MPESLDSSKWKQGYGLAVGGGLVAAAWTIVGWKFFFDGKAHGMVRGGDELGVKESVENADEHEANELALTQAIAAATEFPISAIVALFYPHTVSDPIASSVPVEIPDEFQVDRIAAQIGVDFEKKGSVSNRALFRAALELKEIGYGQLTKLSFEVACGCASTEILNLHMEVAKRCFGSEKPERDAHAMILALAPFCGSIVFGLFGRNSAQAHFEDTLSTSHEGSRFDLNKVEVLFLAIWRGIVLEKKDGGDASLSKLKILVFSVAVIGVGCDAYSRVSHVEKALGSAGIDGWNTVFVRSLFSVMKVLHLAQVFRGRIGDHKLFTEIVNGIDSQPLSRMQGSRKPVRLLHLWKVKVQSPMDKFLDALIKFTFAGV